ncbi:helix-turn-helix domain-containing protein [Amycolatopsis acidicola]|uniref:Helix-turn-helix domain-containing protein n=1 Tax=Amycolatopsis acidicola TaxID=2596893 RepID=A0A5N0VII7_9PSEU|nr:excisionase family DNA-binding protein [Amycolatopsis acidicola]KAA9164980.1 helix-turn-helix domain-containing protein [Amycolatopsis acidicola]
MTNDTKAAEIASLLAKLAELMVNQPQEAPRPATMPERVLLKVEEAAARLGIGRTKTYALVKSGDLESVLIGTLRRIPADAVTAYAARLISAQKAA